ncbi:hypothetical protein, partial [Bacteroides thetaiotaomicron]|uniref:hypothetical protein n=1 Tax=Bacteroides thetaiotaomicron TaxID=818 RepID=UPI00232EDDE1
DTSRQTKNLNKLLIRILLHLQVEFSPFFSSLSEKISFLFACFPKYVHLCSVLSPRYLQSNRL